MSQSSSDKRSPRIPFQANPFASAALGSAWDGATDVAAIHDQQFRRILGLLRQIHGGSKGTSIVITGEPGSGKTHLLGRLRSTLDRDSGHATIYVYVRCNASATTLWRHLQEYLASDLLKPGVEGNSRLDVVLREHAESLDKVNHLALRRALECLRDGRHYHVASAWLRGELITDADLAALGIPADIEDEDRNREAKRIVDALLRFIAPIPVVLCFDQVEALAAYIGDDTGFHAMGQLISALSDGHDHLLLITCIVAAYEDMFERLSNGADRDRWLQEQITLRPIEWKEALQLVQARLDAAPALAGQRGAHAGDPLWPLDAEALKPLFEATGLCLPRKLIHACKRQFENLLDDGVPRPVRSREDFLQEEYAKALIEARLIVQRQGADKTLSECLPWLLQNSGMRPLGQSAERSAYVHLALAGAAGNTGLVFGTGRGNDLTNKLRRAERHWKNPSPLGLKILRDASVTPGKVGAELLAKLKGTGAAEVFVLPEALAALQAIRNMMAAASAGDLAQDGEPVSAEEVSAWALKNLAPQLEKLRDDLAGTTATEPALPQLSALLSRHKIIEAEAAARELGLSAEEVSACARCHPMEFGVLEGPPLVLFEAVEGRSAEASYA